MIELDTIDAKILTVLQQDGDLSQREVAERVGLSQNACWRRIKRLTEGGVITGYAARVAPKALGLDLTVFVLIRTRSHKKDWSEQFLRKAKAIDGVVEAHRIGGDWDYLLKVVTSSISGYDAVYQTLTETLEFDAVTGLFAMETLFDGRPLTPARPR